jgi:DNA modification methylase
MDTNVIYCGDCLIKLKDLPDNSVDLIYIDPPFSSNRNYVAFWQEQEKRHFEDRFENIGAYIDYMRPRLNELYRVLKETGSFYYHCDWHASHYIKGLLDSVFEYRNFRNEIVWKRTTSHGDWKQGAKHFGRVHDIILLYTKSDIYTWNVQFIPFTTAQIAQQYNKIDSEGRRYRLVTPTAKKPGGDTSYEFKGVRPPKGRYWAYTHDKMDEMNKQGLLYYSNTGQPYIKYYLDERPGVAVQSLWDDISPMSPTSKERLGYPTQKPEALLDRIIKTSSNEGDILLDAFCGCGTTLVSAQRMKRKWIGIDISPTSCRIMAKRLESYFGIKEGKDFTVCDLPKSIEELRQYPAFEFQNWAINAIGGIPNKIRVRDMGIDGKLYPVEDIQKEKKEGLDLFGDIDRYIPIQVKRTDQVGRPDIDAFATAIKRDRRKKGIFVSFSFSRDVDKEIRRLERDEGIQIQLITVNEIVEKQLDKQLK